MKLKIGVLICVILIWALIFTAISLIYRVTLSPERAQPSDPLPELTELTNPPDTHSENSSTQTLPYMSSSSSNLYSSSSLRPDDGIFRTSSPSVNEDTPKYAYITLLHGIDTTYSYRGFLYNCLIVKKSLASLNSTVDFVVMVGFTHGEDPQDASVDRDLKVLRKHGIILYYLPRLITSPRVEADSRNNKKEKNKKKQKVPFSEMALLKVTPWSLTQYESIQYFDADVLPYRNMDHFFELKLNTFNTGNASPLNSGWFVAKPNMTDYQRMKALAVQRLQQKWDEHLGWGTVMPSDVTYRGGVKKVQKWGFNGASLDQGLLTHYFMLNEGRIQLIDTREARVYTRQYQCEHMSIAQALTVVSNPQPVVNTETADRAVATKKETAPTKVSLPTSYFHHFTGRSKPWLVADKKSSHHGKRRPSSGQQLWMKHLDDLHMNVNSSNIFQQTLKSPLGYFYPNK